MRRRTVVGVTGKAPGPADGSVPTVPGEDSTVPGVPFAAIGRFVVTGSLGNGAMGLVMSAYDPDLDRQVAIKILRPGTHHGSDRTAVRARLQREAQAMARVSHPNVVHVYELGMIGDHAFIAMELVDGESLRRWLVPRRPWREVVAMFVQAGRGLAAVHAAGLVHGDFKPDNVQIGADGRPRLVDFGQVVSGAPADVEPASSIGTPAYMAPESWSRSSIGPRSDQFSFCVALWEALWGERPRAVATVEPAGAVELRPPKGSGAPRSIACALRRGLAASRSERWPTLEALLDVLERTTRRPSPPRTSARSRWSDGTIFARRTRLL